MSTYDLWEVSGKLAGKAKEFTDPAAARKAVTASKAPAALVHDGKVHTWSPGVTAAQKAVLSAVLATQQGVEREPPGPLAVKAVRREKPAAKAAEEKPRPARGIALTTPSAPCAACGQPSAPHTDALAPELRDLCTTDRDRAQKWRSRQGKTGAEARAWVIALATAQAKGEPPPGRAMQGGPRKAARAEVADVVKGAGMSRAKRAPVAVEVATPAQPQPPSDVLSRVLALIDRAGGLAALEMMVAQVEQLRRAA